MAVDNLKLQQQINEALGERQKLLEKHTAELSRQTTIAEQLRDKLSEVELSDLTVSRANDLTEALEEALEVAQDQKDLHDEYEEAVEEWFEEAQEGWGDVTKSIKQAHKEVSNTAIFFGGFTSGMFETFGFLKKGLSSVLSLAGSAVGSMVSLGKSILTLPISIFSGFVDIANSFSGGTQLAQQFEDIRKQFGDFKTGVSRDIITASKSMRGSLEGTGLSSWRIFGMLHERLKLVTDLMTEMGPISHQFSDEIAGNAEVILQFQKALGISNEAMKGMAMLANMSFTTLADMQRQVANQSLQMGKRFGIDQKLISRDISEMNMDFKNFGSLGVKSMASLSVFARKLGADFKDLLGVVDQFDNFEDAAENAAKLAQSFGLNINAFEMMKEQDPGARIEMLRKEFFATGKTIENMTRQEMALLSATTGLKDGAMAATFAAKNQGLSYAEIQKSSEDAEKQQLTQEEAMSKLADSIERLVKSGQQGGGFWQRFIKGFRQGVVRGKDFWTIIRNIKKSLWAAQKAGRAVGRAFKDYFPGVKTFLKGVGDFFDPKKFKAMANQVVKVFTSFFRDLSDPATSKKALSNLFNSFQSIFGNMTAMQSGAVSQILKGFKAFFGALGKIALSGLNMVMNKFTDFLKNVTRFFKKAKDTDLKTAFKEIFFDMEADSHGLLGNVFKAIVAAIGPASTELFVAMGDAFHTMWDFVADRTRAWWIDVGGLWGLVSKVIGTNTGKMMALSMFGPPFIKGATAAIGNAVIQGLVSSAKSQGVKDAAMNLGGTMKNFLGQEIGGSGGSFLMRAIGWIKKGPLGRAMIPLGLYMGSKLSGAMGMAKGLLKVLGPLGAIAGAAIAGWKLGGYLDKSLGLTDRLSGLKTFHAEAFRDAAKQSDGMISKEKAVLEIWGRQTDVQELRIALQHSGKASAEELNRILKDRHDLSIKDQIIAERALQTMYQKQKMALSAAIVADEEYELGRGGILKNKKDQLELEKKLNAELKSKGFGLEEEAARLKRILGLEKERSGEIDVGAKKAADAIAKKESMAKKVKDITANLKSRMRSGETDITDSEFGMFNKIKKMKPEKVEKVIQVFREQVKPLLMGMKKDMLEIGIAFSDESIAQSIMAVESINRFGGATDSLKSLAEADINEEGIASTIGGMKRVFLSIGQADLMSAFSTLNGNKDAMDSAVASIGTLETTVGGARLLKKQLDLFAKSLDDKELGTDVMSLPVVQGITGLVQTANAISVQLENLKAIDASVKLKSLGVALGLGAKGEFEVKNKSVNIELNLTVNMEADSLVTEIIKTNKFVTKVKT
jgi:hypothetical protein